MGFTAKMFEQDDSIDIVEAPHQFTGDGARRYAETGAQQFLGEYGNLLSCYTLQGEFGLWQTLQTYLVTMGLGAAATKAVEEGNVSAYINSIFVAQVNAFAALFQKGALERLMVVERLPDLAAEELSKLLKYARAKSSSVAPVVPQPVALAPTEQCAQDFKDLGSSAFRSKYISNQNGKKIYERALAEGKIS